MIDLGRFRKTPLMALIAVAVSAGFVFFGLFVVIPVAGGAGVLWTLIAATIMVYHGISVLSPKGMAHEIVEFDEGGKTIRTSRNITVEESVESRLAKVERLRESGHITKEEADQQRRRILDDI